MAATGSRPGILAEDVIGVAADSDADYAGGRSSGVAYLSLDQSTGADFVMSVRARGDPEPLVGELRRALAGVDPAVAVSEIGSGLAVAGPDILFPRIVAGFSSSLGTMAFILELAGLYGVLSHVVAGRTREIGVRMALGASATRIQRMVVREGLSPVLFGLGIGLGLGILARTAMRPVFVRFIPSTDVSLLMLVPAFFVAAGLVACYSPARRASRVDPNVALRSL